MALTESSAASTWMSPASSRTAIAQRWLLPGLIAGAVFLAFEMLAGSITTTVWAFPEGIAHTIGVGSSDYDFQPASLGVGVLVHLTFSAWLGALFIGITRQFRVTGRALVAAAVLFSWAESPASIWVVLHTLLPQTLPLLLGAVPFWASFIGRTAYGLILGLLCASGPFKVTRVRR